jgi:hypothetical protein
MLTKTNVKLTLLLIFSALFVTMVTSSTALADRTDSYNAQYTPWTQTFYLQTGTNNVAITYYPNKVGTKQLKICSTLISKYDIGVVYCYWTNNNGKTWNWFRTANFGYLGPVNPVSIPLTSGSKNIGFLMRVFSTNGKYGFVSAKASIQ